MAYSIEDHVGAVRATLTVADVIDTPLVVAGHSLGAILALEYAARYRTSVRGLILLGLPRYRSAAEAKAYIGRHGSLFAQLMVANGGVAHAVHALHAITQPILIPLVAALAAITHAIPPDIAVDSMHHTLASYSRTLDRCILGHDLMPALLATACIPALMLHGANDPTAPLDAVIAIAAERPNTTLQVLPGGHQLLLEEENACVRAILPFLSNLFDPGPVVKDLRDRVYPCS